MNKTESKTLHPYLTPDLLTLIRTAGIRDIETHFGRVGDANIEHIRLGFHVSFKRGKTMSFVNYHSRPVKRICLDSGYGSDSIKRRVEMTDVNWRESFITRFNEILHDCEYRLAVSQAKRDANAERERKVKTRKKSVEPLLEPLPSFCSWYCENRQTITESLRIDTATFTPEQIAQIVNLVRSCQP